MRRAGHGVELLVLILAQIEADVGFGSETSSCRQNRSHGVGVLLKPETVLCTHLVGHGRIQAWGCRVVAVCCVQLERAGNKQSPEKEVGRDYCAEEKVWRSWRGSYIGAKCGSWI